MKGVIGSHPVSLRSVNLARSYEEAQYDWEREHVIQRAWIRARGPLMGFLSWLIPRRRSIMGEELGGIFHVEGSSSSASADGSRAEADEVGQVSGSATTYTTDDPGGQSGSEGSLSSVTPR